MREEIERLISGTHRLRRMHLLERLELMPQAEMVLLKAAHFAARVGDRRMSSVSEAAKRLRVSQPAISRSLRRLREKGLVVTVTDEEDRRNTYIRLTSLGEAALREDMEKITNFMLRALGHLEPGELSQFTLLFEKIIGGMQEELEKMPQAANHVERDDKRV